MCAFSPKTAKETNAGKKKKKMLNRTEKEKRQEKYKELLLMVQRISGYVSVLLNFLMLGKWELGLLFIAKLESNHY